MPELSRQFPEESIGKVGGFEKTLNGKVWNVEGHQGHLFDVGPHRSNHPMSLHPDLLGGHPEIQHHATYLDAPHGHPEQSWGIHMGTEEAAKERLDTLGTYKAHEHIAGEVSRRGLPAIDTPQRRAVRSEIMDRNEGDENLDEKPANHFMLHLPKERISPKSVPDFDHTWGGDRGGMKGENEKLAHPYTNAVEDRGSTSYVAKPGVAMHPSASILHARQFGMPVHPAWQGRAAAGHADLPNKMMSAESQMNKAARIFNDSPEHDQLRLDHHQAPF